jgi:hypothetical protein
LLRFAKAKIKALKKLKFLGMKAYSKKKRRKRKRRSRMKKGPQNMNLKSLIVDIIIVPI